MFRSSLTSGAQGGLVSTPALALADFDASVRPQDDLFHPVNGTRLATTPIPADKSAWGTFDKLRDDSEATVREIVGRSRSDDQSTMPTIPTTAFALSRLTGAGVARRPRSGCSGMWSVRANAPVFARAQQLGGLTTTRLAEHIRSGLVFT